TVPSFGPFAWRASDACQAAASYPARSRPRAVIAASSSREGGVFARGGSWIAATAQIASIASMNQPPITRNRDRPGGRIIAAIPRRQTDPILKADRSNDILPPPSRAYNPLIHSCFPPPGANPQMIQHLLFSSRGKPPRGDGG